MLVDGQEMPWGTSDIVEFGIDRFSVRVGSL
jgi:hypothetical protein